MMKDEGPYLLEWLAHYRIMGFDRIVVLHNDCTDGTDAMLARLQAMGEVVAVPHRVAPGKKPQPSALRLAETLPGLARTDWLLLADSDEFLDVAPGAGRLADLIDALPSGTQAVAATWRVMGSNGLTDWNPGPVTQCYRRGAPDDFRKGWGVKTLFRPFEGMKLGIHRPTIREISRDPQARATLEAQTWVNGAGLPLTRRFKREAWLSTTLTVGYGLVEMKHFATRSRENFLLRAARGNVNDKARKYDAAYFAIFDRNEDARESLSRQADARAAQVKAWLSDPDLARLQARSLAHHAARMAALRAAPGFAQRIQALEEASRVPYDRLDEVLHIQPLPRQARAQIEEMLAQGVREAAIVRMLLDNPAVAARRARIDAEDAADYAEMGLAGKTGLTRP